MAFHTTVGDDLETNVAAFRTAIDRADIVVATGGLGPTADDLTREAIAAAAGVELVQDDAALAHIRNLFARRGRAMPERNVLQAQFPRGSRVGAESARHGAGHRHDGPAIVLARRAACSRCPACRPRCSRCGRQPWPRRLRPRMPSQRVIRHRRIKCFGVGESDLEAMLPDMIRRKREPLVGITVSGATITLRITASGPNEAACLRAMEPTVAQIREMLGVLVFGEEDDELEHAVVRLLERAAADARRGRMGDRRAGVAVAGRGGRGQRLLSRRHRRSRCGNAASRCLDVDMSPTPAPMRKPRRPWLARSAKNAAPISGLASPRFPPTGPQCRPRPPARTASK